MTYIETLERALGKTAKTNYLPMQHGPTTEWHSL